MSLNGGNRLFAALNKRKLLASPSTCSSTATLKQELEPESRLQLELLDKVNEFDTNMPLKSIRKSIELASFKFRGDFTFNGSKEEHIIPSPGHGIPVTVLQPKPSHEHHAMKNVMVYFHGGGWTWGSRKTHMAFCEMVCV